MIVRHIPMKAVNKSSFSGLIQYMTSEHGKQERVGEIYITNCQSTELEWAVHEIQATQALNQRAYSDKTYHLLISFPAGEIPSPEVLKDIENEVCSSIGYGEHQRISVVHYDTDNFHIHVGINKIHPTRYTLHEPYQAYKKLGEMASHLEIKHGLQVTNHIPHKVGSENRADDMEHHSGIGSLLNWIKQECLKQLQEACSWSQFHAVLQQHGLELRERGNGLVIVAHSEVGVKASSVSRDFSKAKLERKLGSFEKSTYSRNKLPLPSQKKPKISKIGQKPPPRSQNRLYSLNQLQTIHIEQGSQYIQEPVHMKINTTQLYDRYQEEQRHSKTKCSAELARARERKNQLIESAKRSGRLKRAAIKCLHGANVSKKALYSLTSQAVKKAIEEAQKNYFKERESIYIKYQHGVWADWLKLKANEGDVEALNALRSREMRQKLKGDLFTGQKLQRKESIVDIPPDNITKTGTIIYRVGTCTIRDDGEFIKISRGSSTEGIAAALRMAINRYGQSITVNGSDFFKEQIVKVATDLKLNITFDNEKLELRRQFLINRSINKDHNHAPRRKSDFNSGRTNRGCNEAVGSANLNKHARRGGSQHSGTPFKPNIGRIGQQPPPESKNRLRSLSQLSMVQLASRSEMLLSGYVFGHMEHQGTQSDNGLRRDVPGTGAVTFISDAADKYIAERELKRQTITNILMHRRYNKNDTGFFQFLGTRQVDGELLILLKRDDCIIVVPMSKNTVAKIKHLSVGSPVHLTSNGIVANKGRNR